MNRMVSGYKVTCKKEDCFGCVDGECVILRDNNFHGKECRFYKSKSERPVLAYKYQKENGK